MPLKQPQTLNSEHRSLRAMLYGRTATGKTLAASTAQDHPDLGPVLFINIDDGLTTIAHRHDIHYYNFETLQDIVDLQNEFSKERSRRDGIYATFNTVIIDSISKLKDDLLEEDRTDKSGNRAAHLTYTNWNNMMDAILRFIDTLANSDVHMILIAGADYEDQNGVTIVRPDVNPALWRKVGHRMDFIWRTYIQNGRFRIQIADDGQFTGKTRNPELLRLLREYNTDAIKKKLPTDSLAKLSDDDLFRLSNVLINDGPNFSTFPLVYDMYIKATKELTDDND
jgi:hypothetical protein